MMVSVIILTWNSDKFISECLSSLVNSMEDTLLDYEVIVVDNGSSDTTVQLVDRFVAGNPDKFNIICLENNQGTTISRNIGIKSSKGEYIAIIDSDIIFTEKIIPDLICSMESRDNIGMVVPLLRYKNGKYQKSVDTFPTIQRKMARFFFLKYMAKEKLYETSSKDIFVDYAISAFWLVSRKTIEDVGLLDENFFYAPEDVDYCLRVWKAGYKVMYVPNISAIHDAQEISRGFNFSKAKVEHLKGLMYFFRKHRYLFSKPRF